MPTAFPTLRRSLSRPAFASALALLAAAGLAQAQPVLELHSLLDADLAPSGEKAVGYVYDAGIEQYRVVVWQRGVGYTFIPQASYALDPIRGSDDMTIFATGAANTSNWAELNCFAGYCTQTGDGCVAGELQTPPSPCIIPNIAHRYTPAGGWQNLGSLPRTFNASVGRFSGGTRCDSTINSVGDMSGDGRYIVGGAWTSPLFTASGGISFGQCGNLEAYIKDAVTDTITPLPVAPDNAGDSRADHISADGSVITGYDFGTIQSEFGPFDGRRSVVWTNGVQTILDGISGFGDGFPVNRPGTVIAGAPSAEFISQVLGGEEQELVRWTRQPNNSWTPTRHGRPVDIIVNDEPKPLLGISVSGISNDGNTIVGNASYGTSFFDRVSRAFIWSPTINGGVPQDLGEYIASIAPTCPIVASGLTIFRTTGISADGQAIGVQIEDARSTCAIPEDGLATGLSGVLYLGGGTCNPPVVGLPPRDNTSIQYTPFGVALNVTVSGTWPMTFQWQREDASAPGTWNNLSDACAGFGFGAEWDYEGTDKNQVRIGQATCGNNRGGEYRVALSNGCGTLNSDAATVTFQQGTVVTQQPSNASTCPGQNAFLFGVAVSNSADLSAEWLVSLPSDPGTVVVLNNGANVLPDGRTAEVFGADGQFLGINPGFLGAGEASTYNVQINFISPCGNQTSNVVTLSVGGVCPLVCDGIDFNNDGLFPDDNDLITFLVVLAGGECPDGNFCNDIDFNNDELFPDDSDLIAFLRVLAGGECEE
jgi:hypothetical protein